MHISPQSRFSQPSELKAHLDYHGAMLSSSDHIYVSGADGRWPEVSGVAHYEPEAAYLEVAVGGGVVTVKPERPPGAGGFSGEPGGAGRVVAGFSRQSKNRLTRLIATTDKAKRPVFATLTYPDEFSRDEGVWKRHLDSFGKRFRRLFPGGSFIWRIEFKDRKSGVAAGEIAPHFHLLVWGTGLYEFRQFAGVAWGGVVQSGDERHLRAGTSSERVRTWNGVMSYVSKYVAKEEDYPPGWTGRAWGVVGRENLPLVPVVRFLLDPEHAVRMVRLGRKLLRLTGKTLIYGLTFLVDPERILDYWEILAGFG